MRRGDDVRIGGLGRQLVRVDECLEDLGGVLVGSRDARQDPVWDQDAGGDAEPSETKRLLVDRVRATGSAGAEPRQDEGDVEWIPIGGIESRGHCRRARDRLADRVAERLQRAVGLHIADQGFNRLSAVFLEEDLIIAPGRSACEQRA